MADLKRLHNVAEDLDRWHKSSTGFRAFIRKLFRLKAKEVFNLDHWFGSDLNDSCGTVCCAMGYIALQPKYNRLGLTVESSFVHCPKYGSSSGWHAVSEFFGISQTEAVYLFSAEKYEGKVTAADVAARIRNTFPKE